MQSTKKRSLKNKKQRYLIQDKKPESNLRLLVQQAKKSAPDLLDLSDKQGFLLVREVFKRLADNEEVTLTIPGLGSFRVQNFVTPPEIL